MRVHFQDVRRAARVAKLLRAALAAHGIEAGLRRVQDIVATGYGYASHAELQANVGRGEASQWDEDVPSETAAARAVRWIEALTQAGMTREQAMACVSAIRPSGRRLGQETPAVVPDRSKPTWPEPDEISERKGRELAKGIPAGGTDVVGPDHFVVGGGHLVVAKGGGSGDAWHGLMRRLATEGFRTQHLHVLADDAFAVVQADLILDDEIPSAWLGWERVSGKDVSELRLSHPPDFNAGYREGLVALPNGTVVVDAATLGDPGHDASLKIIREFDYHPERFLVAPSALVRHLQRKGVAEQSEKASRIEGETLLHNLLVVAAVRGMPSVFVDVGRDGATVGGRLYGVVQEMYDLPAEKGHALCSAAHRLVRHNEYEHDDWTRFQSGSASTGTGKLPPGVAALRVELLPAPNGGRSMHVRIFPTREVADKDRPERSGLTVTQRSAIDRMVREPVGLMLVSGPPTSGKSTTLAESVRASSRVGGGRRVVCVNPEDPGSIPGATVLNDEQFRDHGHQGERYAALSRSVLASDAETVVISEIDGPAPARLAFDAAMSGRQVWTTVRANGALQSLERMRVHGIELHTLCDPALVRGLVSQRVLRTVCPDCSDNAEHAIAAGWVTKDSVAATDRVLGLRHDPERLRFACPGGCPSCSKGYAGRILVAEAIVPSPSMLKMVAKGDMEQARRHWLNSEGGVTMLERAVEAVASGLTDVAEVEARVGFLDQLDNGYANRIDVGQAA